MGYDCFSSHFKDFPGTSSFLLDQDPDPYCFFLDPDPERIFSHPRSGSISKSATLHVGTYNQIGEFNQCTWKKCRPDLELQDGNCEPRERVLSDDDMHVCRWKMHEIWLPVYKCHIRPSRIGNIWNPERKKIFIFFSVAEPKLFLFSSGSDFDHNFGSGSSSSYSHILALKTVLKH